MPPVQATSLQKLGKGDISGVLSQAMDNAVSINAPTFFSTSTNLFQSTIAAIQFGFTGVSVAPCAIPITPLGIGIFPQVRCLALVAQSSSSKHGCSHALCDLLVGRPDKAVKRPCCIGAYVELPLPAYLWARPGGGAQTLLLHALSGPAAVQGINIQPEGFNIAPTGVNIQPQGASISPTLIVIGPYDTTVAGQVSTRCSTPGRPCMQLGHVMGMRCSKCRLAALHAKAHGCKGTLHQDVSCSL